MICSEWYQGPWGYAVPSVLSLSKTNCAVKSRLPENTEAPFSSSTVNIEMKLLPSKVLWFVSYLYFSSKFHAGTELEKRWFFHLQIYLINPHLYIASDSHCLEVYKTMVPKWCFQTVLRWWWQKHDRFFLLQISRNDDATTISVDQCYYYSSTIFGDLTLVINTTTSLQWKHWNS